MSLREDILSASDEGRLLQAIAVTRYSEEEHVAELLAELHNAGDVNLLEACSGNQLEAFSQDQFFDLQRIFCATLPHLCCSTAEALAVCERFFDKAGADLSAGSVYRALQEWFSQTIERVEDGLVFVRTNKGVAYGAIRALLLAGSTRNVEQCVHQGLELSQGPDENARRAALSALGWIAPAEGPLSSRVVQRLRDVIEGSATEEDQVAAFDATLDLLERSGDADPAELQRLVLTACRHPGALLRHAIAEGLRDRRGLFTDAMADAAFPAIGNTDCNYAGTISVIDSMLYQWDIERDRKRVLSLFMQLVGRDENAVDVKSLSNFRHRMANGPGPLLGWYVVSLLLTGNDKLGNAAADLLPYQELRDGLDIDLSAFGLTPIWVLFLAGKILGYCVLKKEGSAALLLSCLRSLAVQDPTELENITLDYFLINYPTAIELFESAVSPADVAAGSVTRLRAALDNYLEGLRQHGTCAAFTPSERERVLQRYQQLDFWRGVQDIAEQQSVFVHVAHRIPMLYGTALVTHVYPSPESEPVRQEVPLSSIEHTADVPRLDAMDPLGLQYARFRFKKEHPPS